MHGHTGVTRACKASPPNGDEGEQSVQILGNRATSRATGEGLPSHIHTRRDGHAAALTRLMSEHDPLMV